MTVQELLKETEAQVKKGNGNKEVYISNDDEGNGFHALFFSFTDEPEDIKANDCYGDIKEPEKVVLLG